MLNLRCAQCFRPVSIQSTAKSVNCPACSTSVLVVNDETKAYYMAEGVQPSWKRAWGKGLLFAVAILAPASFIYGGNHGQAHFEPNAGFVTVALNPFVWVLFVLGLIWGNSGGSRRSGAAVLPCHEHLKSKVD